MEILVRLIGTALLIHGLASEGATSQFLLVAGGLIILFGIYGRLARRPVVVATAPKLRDGLIALEFSRALATRSSMAIAAFALISRNSARS
jgi:hypothetical protein